MGAPLLEKRATDEPYTLVLVLSGVVEREDVPGLCRRACALLESGGAVRVVCDVGALNDPDAVTVETLARLQLAARHRGMQVHLSNASQRLLELLDLVGLSEALPPCGASGVEVRGQPE